MNNYKYKYSNDVNVEFISDTTIISIALQITEGKGEVNPVLN
jgi:hypothetical protein